MIHVINNVVAPIGDGTTSNKVGIYFKFQKSDFSSSAEVRVALLAKKSTDSEYKDYSSSCTIQKCTNRGSSEILGTSSALISNADFGEEFKIEFIASTLPVSDVYIRVFTADSSMISEKIYLSIGKKTLSFQTKSLNRGNKEPKKIKVEDDIICFDQYHNEITNAIKNNKQLTVSIMATNNADDASPVWENITTAYLNNSFYEFTNENITANNWAVAVKYSLTKLYLAENPVNVNVIKVNTVNISTI